MINKHRERLEFQKKHRLKCGETNQKKKKNNQKGRKKPTNTGSEVTETSSVSKYINRKQEAEYGKTTGIWSGYLQ